MVLKDVKNHETESLAADNLCTAETGCIPAMLCRVVDSSRLCDSKPRYYNTMITNKNPGVQLMP